MYTSYFYKSMKKELPKKNPFRRKTSSLFVDTASFLKKKHFKIKSNYENKINLFFNSMASGKTRYLLNSKILGFIGGTVEFNSKNNFYKTRYRPFNIRPLPGSLSEYDPIMYNKWAKELRARRRVRNSHKIFHSFYIAFFQRFTFFVNLLEKTTVARDIGFLRSSSKKHVFAYIKHSLLSIFFSDSIINKKLKYFYLGFVIKYFIFNLYSLVNTFVTTIKEEEEKKKLRKKKKKIKVFDSPLLPLGCKKKSSDFYTHIVFKQATRPIYLYPETFSEKVFLPLLLRRFSKIAMKKKRIPLDDKRFSNFFLILQGHFNNKGCHHFDLLGFMQWSIDRVRPLHKIIYQRRGRNILAFRKFLFKNKLRDSMALKWLLKSCNSSGMKLFSNHSVEYKLALIFLDIIYNKGLPAQLLKSLEPSKGSSAFFNKRPLKKPRALSYIK